MIAEKQDATDALKLWSYIERSQTTKLNSKEQKVVDTLRAAGELNFNELKNTLGLSASQLSQIMKGRDGRDGLLEKVPEISEEKVSFFGADGSTRWTKKYKIDTPFDPSKFHVP